MKPVTSAKAQPKNRAPSAANTAELLLLLESGHIYVNAQNGEIFYRDGRKVPQRTNFFGYKQFVIFHIGKACTFYTHKAVWIASRGELPVNFEIDHIDHDKENNGIGNLQSLPWRINCMKQKKTQMIEEVAF